MKTQEIINNLQKLINEDNKEIIMLACEKLADLQNKINRDKFNY